MQFFRYFPTVPYSLTSPNTSVTFDMTQLTAHIKLTERLKQVVTIYQDYLIQDGERPDTVAFRLYGDTKYTWILLVVNNIFSLYDWPLSNDEFDRYIIDQYGSASAAQSGLIYRTSAGYVVDVDTYNTLPGNQRGVPTSFYDVEVTRNESKRRIKIVPASFIPAIQQELVNIF